MKITSTEFTGGYLTELLAITKIGTWDWHLPTATVIYSKAWAELVGYTVEELPQTLDTWERIVLPEDLDYANEQIELHLSGEKPLYEAEFRMICKDGSIIWAQDKGRVTEYDENGNPIRFVGVIQNVSRLKETEYRLRENQETLDLAVQVAELGTWDWDIPGNTIRYNDEYLKMLGYSQSDINGSMEEWESMNHPEDLPHSLELLNAYLSGIIPKYECEIRMKHKDGNYIWTRDVGRIVMHDAEGNPTRLIGGHLNIDALKISEKQLAETLKKLENHHKHLEKEIANRTKTLTEQDKMLWAVNDISKQLFSVNNSVNIDDMIIASIKLYCASSGNERISLWKNKNVDDKPYCSLLYEWSVEQKKITNVDLTNKDNLLSILKNIDYELSSKELSVLFDNTSWKNLSYDDQLPTFYKTFLAGEILNCLASDLTPLERFYMHLQGIKSLLVTPIYLNDEIWGFISADNCETEAIFSDVEEKMLSIVGFFLANSIQKFETEKKVREAEERIQLMLNAMPLCCNLWTRDFNNMSCNEEAARLFELSSQKEYLERFSELSPKYQPNGRLSGDLAVEYIKEAFNEGFCRFEWLHHKLDGTLIPAEVTLVRIKYKDDYIVAGYTRDLRELKATLAELQAKEDDLRAARDEALLSSKAKSNFLANMSHEIRTPMNAISGLAEIILRESRGSQSAEHALGIKSACNNLLNIINDILDISKIESGKLEITNAQYELSSLLNDVITISRMRLGKKPLMFITDIDSKLPAKLIGDEIRTKQILINLLSNAIKFTQEGHIALRVSGQIEGNKVALRFSVTDTGFGIKPEDLARLFEEFERVNTTKNRNIEGTGLGLPISKQLCEMMGGTIEVESTFGEGSIFTATIPQEFIEYERLSQVNKPKSVLLYEPREIYMRSIKESIENLDCKCIPCSNQSEFYDNINIIPYDYVLTSSIHLAKVKTLVKKNKLQSEIAVFADYYESINDNSIYTIFFPINCLQMADMLNGEKNNFGYVHDHINDNFTAPTAQILVVDDNQVNLKVAIGLMAPYQFMIDTAVNGLEAVEKVKNKKYDLVFMDHMMPEMDGIDATVAIRQLEGEYYRSLPIIALTANALVGTREMFISEGMNDFLAKPIEIGKLCNVLAKWIPPHKKIISKPEDLPKVESQDFETEISGVNTKQGIMSVGGNKDDYIQILSSYYNDGKEKCSSLLNHFTQKNILAFRTEVHALKSTSATIGAVALATMAAKLEDAAQKENLEFIDEHIDEFLSNLQKVLEAIRPLVKTADLDEDSADDLATGDFAELHEKIENLYNAVELANIGKIEDIIANLKKFSWPEEIKKEFSAINEHLALFDYDAALECVDRLKNISKV